MTGANIAAAARPRPSRRIVFGLLIVLALLAVVALMMSARTADVTQILPTAAASALPVVGILGYCRTLTAWRLEPPAFYLIPLLWGCSIAIILAASLESLATAFLGSSGSRSLGVPVFAAPMAEEISKALIVLFLLRSIRHLVVDPLISAVMFSILSGTGFAFVENVGWIMRAVRTGPDVELYTVVGRLVLIIGLHPLTTSLVGIGCSLAWSSGRFRWRFPLLGLVSAMTIHGLWNYFTYQSLPAALAYYLMVFLPLLALLLAVLQHRRNLIGRITRRRLPSLVDRGLISPREAGLLQTVADRRRLMTEAGRQFGRYGRAEMGRWQRNVVDLALVDDRCELTAEQHEQQRRTAVRLAQHRAALVLLLDDLSHADGAAG